MELTHGPATVFPIFLWILSLTESKEALVTCLFHEDCMLPCSFRPLGAVVIHWYKQQIPVHSYYYHKDQFGLQNKHFNGRTSLFNSQITHGNASLLLRRVKVQDKGKYKCYTSTRKGNQETFVNLGVKALTQSVRIGVTNETVSCSSQNIYPAPQVAWSTEPYSPPEMLLNSTVKTPDSRGLYDVESTVKIVGNLSDHAYFCSVISADRAQVWTASLRRPEELTGEEGKDLSIPCMAPQNLQNFSLTWTFTRADEPALDILRYDSRTGQTHSLWEDQARLEQHQVLTGNGSLLLRHTESSEHTGIYTCTFSGLHSRHMVQTQVNITDTPPGEDPRSAQRSWWGTAASLALCAFTVSVALPRWTRHQGELTAHYRKDGQLLSMMRSSHADAAMIDMNETRANEHGEDTQAVFEPGPKTPECEAPQLQDAESPKSGCDLPNTDGSCHSPDQQLPCGDEVKGDVAGSSAPRADGPQLHMPESNYEPENDVSTPYIKGS